ncbi:MAG: hypothetical protein EZS28_013089 [Streblomastix strix]|uniref:Uncharacterized protein n=1 Tax=Streblomastix strix TaxID=222440 RepID=A0A5J4W9P2_9EUKA|nr:MAG: hypothetical protein EZS28_013089 [Streblomastix strix]
MPFFDILHAVMSILWTRSIPGQPRRLMAMLVNSTGIFLFISFFVVIVIPIILVYFYQMRATKTYVIADCHLIQYSYLNMPYPYNGDSGYCLHFFNVNVTFNTKMENAQMILVMELIGKQLIIPLLMSKPNSVILINQT